LPAPAAPEIHSLRCHRRRLDSLAFGLNASKQYAVSLSMNRARKNMTVARYMTGVFKNPLSAA
jgi:hypothetical protein